MKSIILFLILAFAQPSQAQMSCMGLFNFTRPSEEETNTAIYELKYLLKEQYSNDSIVSTFARSESQKKLFELKTYLTSSEINEKLRNMNISEDHKNLSQDQFRESGNRLLQEIEDKRQIDLYLAGMGPLKKGDALHAAVKNNDTRIVKMLLRYEPYKSKINSINNASLTINVSPLMIATKAGNKELVELLINNGADVNLLDITAPRNNADQSPLMLAAGTGRVDIAELLIKNGADVNLVDGWSNNALIIAITKRNNNIYELLLKNNADTNIKTNDGATALSTAVQVGDAAAVKLLLEYKADPNIKNNSGRTPLMYASAYHRVFCVKLLLQHNVDLNIKDNDGLTALGWAFKNKTYHVEIIEMLKAAGAVE